MRCYRGPQQITTVLGVNTVAGLLVIFCIWVFWSDWGETGQDDDITHSYLLLFIFPGT